MAEPGEDLLEGELGDGEYNELDADEEEALLADDNGYAGYNLPSVTSHRDVYISTSPDAKASRKIKVEDVEDVAEGDEILDNEDVLELGVEGNWNLDDLDSESQDKKRNSERKPSLFQLWIKQERVDSAEFSRSNEPENDEEEQEQNISSENSNKKSAFITSSADISQSHLHDDDDEDDHERRDRFTSERSLPGIISLKSPDTKWGAIPDSLDSVITPIAPKAPVQKSPRGGGTVRRGGTPGRRGGSVVGRGDFRPPTQDGPHHKVLINPHFKGSTPAPPQFPQTHPGDNFRDAQQHFDHPGHQYQKQQEYQQYQPPINSQYPPHSQQQYQEPTAFSHNTPDRLHPSPGQGPHYQNDWQNPVGTQQQYEQHNYPGYYEESPASVPPAWNPPVQPVYQDYNQRLPHPHAPHHQSPHRQPPPPHQPPHHQPHLPHPHPDHAMRPPAPPDIHHIVSQQQPPPPGLEAEFQARKVQFSNENKVITVQMYSESAPGDDVRGSPAHNQFGNKMGPPRPQPPDQYLNRPPGPFPHQGGPPRPYFPHQPYRPQGSFGVPNQQQPPRMFPPSPQNQPPRFSPRFKRGGFQRGGFSPQFRHPAGPRMMQPGPSPPNVIYNPRLPNYQQQPIKRTHPEAQVPHQPPFKQMRPNPNCPEGLPPNIAITQTVKRKRNLLEVQTVDNVPDTTTFSDQGVEEEFDEDDDEETREYKRKIAEQKRLREKLLQEKEERRKLAAVAKQKELEQQKVTSQNVPNSQSVSNPQNPAYSVSSQPTVNAEGNRISVHQRIGVKPSPTSQIPPGSTQVTVFNEQQPTAFKIVRVRTKDGTVLIKKLPINSAGQVMIQRPAHMPAPPHVVHHQPVPARHLLQQMEHHHLQHPNPPHHPPPHHQPPPPPAPPQYQHIYPQQPAPPHPAPHTAPPPPQQHTQYFHPQPNPTYQQPQTVQQPFYQQPTHQAPRPPQIIQHQSPVPVVNSKRIVLNRPQITTFKPNFQNRSRVRPMLNKPHSSVITIVPVNKNMTLGQRFAMQNQQVKKDKNQQQEKKLPVQAQPGTKQNRTVINSVLNAGAPTIKTPLPPGPITSNVVVDNLTAGTSRQQLVSMAEQVGEVKILTLDTSQKRASITFNNTKAATAFYQKFQRKMVNLSMINVSFVPE